jgi:hypothetical protein
MSDPTTALKAGISDAMLSTGTFRYSKDTCLARTIHEALAGADQAVEIV